MHKHHHDEKGHHTPAKSKIAEVLRGGHGAHPLVPPKHAKSHYGGPAKKPGNPGPKGDKVHKVMSEFKHGTLKGGAGKHPKVTSRKQAIAIALSEARRAGQKVAPK